MKYKKGQGFSLNVIIVAIILLIVLVILVVIFTGKTRKFSGQVESCLAKGGYCYSPPNSDQCFEADEKGRFHLRQAAEYLCECPEGEAKILGTDCEGKAMLCCVKVEK